jgi:hypothetical protein
MTYDPGDLAKPSVDEGIRSTWAERGRADGPIAFRAVVRATIEGAESRNGAPDQQASAVLFAWTKDGVQESLAPALAALTEIVNHDDGRRRSPAARRASTWPPIGRPS